MNSPPKAFAHLSQCSSSRPLLSSLLYVHRAEADGYYVMQASKAQLSRPESQTTHATSPISGEDKFPPRFGVGEP